MESREFIINKKIMIKTYIPDLKECICDKKILLSRAKIPFSKQSQFLYMNQKINKIISESLNNIDPKIFYTNLDVKDIEIDIIPKSFNGIGLLTIFISTLGDIFDRYIDNLIFKEEYFEMFIADSWGSESLEKINKNFDKKLRDKYKNGTIRFSPGYKDIDITVNKIIINEIFKIKEIKVYDSGIMKPRKSTVCFIGWFI